MARDALNAGERRFSQLLAGWNRRRVAITVIAGAVGAGLGYAASWALTLATCTNGGCPTATEPVPFIALLAIVAAWSAGSGSQR